MARGKAQKKSTTKAKRALVTSRVTPARTTGKKTAGATGMRATTSGRRDAQLEETMPRTRRPAVKVARASKMIKRRPRKSDI